MSVVEWIFWVSVGTIAYAYLGYGLAIALLGLIVRRPVPRTDALPAVTVLVAAYDEEADIAAKVENALGLEYPAEKLELLVVADGSTDRTVEIVRAAEAREPAGRVRLLFEPERRGKGNAVARAVPEARGEVLVLSDANTMFEPDVVRKLVRNLADARVALVAGEKRVAGGGGEGLYWRYESLLKRLDTRLGSVMGAAGEIFAIRKANFRPPPADAIIEDFELSMGLVRDGWRAVYEPEAVATEPASLTLRDEFERRARNTAGGWRAVVRLRGLLSPRHGIAAFQFFSHRVLRWMVVPLLLPVALAANAALAAGVAPSGGGDGRRALYVCVMAFHVLFYILAAGGFLEERRGRRAGKVMSVPFYFAFANLAALAGARRWLTGAQTALWSRAARRPAGAIPS